MQSTSFSHASTVSKEGFFVVVGSDGEPANDLEDALLENGFASPIGLKGLTTTAHIICSKITISSSSLHWKLLVSLGGHHVVFKAAL